MADIKGILGTKLGMTQIFDDTRAIPVTVIKAGPCFVAQVKTEAKDGYSAVQLAFGPTRPNGLTKPEQGHFDAHGGQTGRHVVEIRTDDAASYEPGQELRADVFEPGERADVVGVSKGKGFAGPMKRHGFSGLSSSHGTERKHRSPGAIGACATPSRVFKGMRMAGQMGNERVTVLNLEIVRADRRAQPAAPAGRDPGPRGRPGDGPFGREGTRLEGRALMPKVDVVSVAGKKVGTRDLAPEVFEAKVSVPLMHQVVLAGFASIRRGTHSTKTRGEVSGGGRKPWRQKGTGRARQGSNRSPQWTGGGVVHGPHPRDHEMRVNKKMKRGALRSALTDALTSGKLSVVQDLAFDAPKTKTAAEVLDTLELGGKVLLVLPLPSDSGAVEKSFRNIRGVRVAYARSLGVYEVIAADHLVITESALDVVEGSPAEEARAEKPAKEPAENEPAEKPAAEGEAE